MKMPGNKSAKLWWSRSTLLKQTWSPPKWEEHFPGNIEGWEKESEGLPCSPLFLSLLAFSSRLPKKCLKSKLKNLGKDEQMKRAKLLKLGLLQIGFTVHGVLKVNFEIKGRRESVSVWRFEGSMGSRWFPSGMRGLENTRLQQFWQTNIR